MIKGLEEFLKGLCTEDSIKAMIPGEIKPVKKASAELIVRRLMPTCSGVKALIQSGAAVQETFFTGEAEAIVLLLTPFLRTKGE